MSGRQLFIFEYLQHAHVLQLKLLKGKGKTTAGLKVKLQTKKFARSSDSFDQDFLLY